MSDDKPRATSNVLTKFSQSQIQEMKEAFTMIDQDRDGLINVQDLKDMYANLGVAPNDTTLSTMVKEAPGPLNFTAFLSLFCEKLHGTVPSDSVLDKMVKEIPSGSVNFTAFLSMFSDKLSGTAPTDKILGEMVKEASQMNFTGFLSMFSDKMSGTDPEDTLRNAFAMFDAENTGWIGEEYLRDLLQNMGDNFNADEIRQTMKEAIGGDGKCHYNEFVAKLKGKEQDE